MQKPLPKGWKWVKLGEVADGEKFSIRMGPFGSQLKKHELVNEGIKVLWIENIVDNEFKWLDNKSITEGKFKQLEGFKVKPNDILTTTMGTIARTCVVPSNIGKAIISSHLLKISPDLSRINPTFVAKYMSSGFALRYFDKKAHGIVMKGLNTSIIKNLPIPLPPLSTQHKIVEILEEADNLRKLRRQADEKMKDLIPSLFVRMFGDPATNPKGWEMISLGDVCNKPEYGVTATATNSFIGPKFLRITDIQNGNVDWNKVPYCECSDIDRNKSRLSIRDIVVARIGSTTGKAYLVRDCPDAVFASYLIRLRTNDSLLPEFLFAFMDTKSYWTQINSVKGTRLKQGINIPVLINLKFPLPPLPLQQEFAKLVEGIEAEKARQAEGKKKLDELFNSLMQRAFTGELVA
ncbi:MAG: hypothetical protein C4538_00075 [Nitrospiraceae bacterium]|nr:MAG: hypothetical protein C4538_00075 [Nitrospiraceae bacterium]